MGKDGTLRDGGGVSGRGYYGWEVAGDGEGVTSAKA